MKKIKISLCDLANDLNGIDNKSIPIGVGYISAYCKKIHGDSVKIKVLLSTKFQMSKTENIIWDFVNNYT